jgi:hypothetical protein
LGFALLGVSDRSACRGLHRDSSCVLNDSADGGHPSRTHLRVSITERLPQPVAGPRPLLGFLHLSASKHSSQREPGLCVHLTGGPPLLADPTGSWGSRGSTGAARRRTSVLGLVVAPPACGPGEDTFVTWASRLHHLARGRPRLLAVRWPRATGLTSDLSGCLVLTSRRRCL